MADGRRMESHHLKHLKYKLCLIMLLISFMYSWLKHRVLIAKRLDGGSDIAKLLGEGKKLGILEGAVCTFSITSLLSPGVEGICVLRNQLHAVVVWTVLQGGI